VNDIASDLAQFHVTRAEDRAVVPVEADRAEGTEVEVTTEYCRSSRAEVVYERVETIEVELDGFRVRLEQGEARGALYVRSTVGSLDGAVAGIDGRLHGWSWQEGRIDEPSSRGEDKVGIAVEGLRLMDKAMTEQRWPPQNKLRAAVRDALEGLRHSASVPLVTVASAARAAADVVRGLRTPALDPRDKSWRRGWDMATEDVGRYLDVIARNGTLAGPAHAATSLRAAAADVRSLQPRAALRGEQSLTGWRDGLAAAALILEGSAIGIETAFPPLRAPKQQVTTEKNQDSSGARQE
jgi:hypothetical protein